MPTLSKPTLTHTKNVQLGTVDLTYDCMLICEELECSADMSFSVFLDLKGKDSRVNPDDDLILGIDLGTVRCETGFTDTDPDLCGAAISGKTTVASHLLDEDWGTDEVYCVIRVRDTASNTETASPRSRRIRDSF